MSQQATKPQAAIPAPAASATSSSQPLPALSPDELQAGLSGPAKETTGKSHRELAKLGKRRHVISPTITATEHTTEDMNSIFPSLDLS